MVDTITSNVHELRELLRMQEELQAEIDALKDSLKNTMKEQHTDILTGTDFKITWKPVTSNRLDTKALKLELPEIAARYTKQNTSRRFVLS